MNMVEVRTAELSGAALDWAVASAIGELNPQPGLGGWGCVVSHGHTLHRFCPSTEWAHGGPLIEKYKVLLTPPTEMVHRNFGNFDKRNGWYESGHWGSTIFGKERKHRRAAFSHPDSPLIVAMRAIVQFELGDTVQIPAELVQEPRHA